jgi:hypothetical protein
VLIVALPVNGAVHWKTCSGELSVVPQVPANALGPEVVPVKVPPCGGTRAGLAQESGVAVTVGVGVTVGVAVTVGVTVTVGVAVTVGVGVTV